MAKIQFALLLLCLAQVCLSARIVREAEVEPTSTTEQAVKAKCAAEESDSSSEFTMADVSKMKAELLADDMPEKHVNILTNVFSKMTTDKTNDEKLEGFMKVMALVMALSQNQTEDSLLKVVESFDSTEKVNEIPQPIKL